MPVLLETCCRIYHHRLYLEMTDGLLSDESGATNILFRCSSERPSRTEAATSNRYSKTTSYCAIIQAAKVSAIQDENMDNYNGSKVNVVVIQVSSQ